MSGTELIKKIKKQTVAYQGMEDDFEYLESLIADKQWKETHMCEYCIMGQESHGEEIFVGAYNIYKPCECCGDTENVHDVVYEIFL